jgi:hypothetical protein
MAKPLVLFLDIKVLNYDELGGYDETLCRVCEKNAVVCACLLRVKAIVSGSEKPLLLDSCLASSAEFLAHRVASLFFGLLQ